MDKQNGFTVIELVVLIMLLSIIGFVAWTQINHIEIAARDDKRRIADRKSTRLNSSHRL